MPGRKGIEAKPSFFSCTDSAAAGITDRREGMHSMRGFISFEIADPHDAREKKIQAHLPMMLVDHWHRYDCVTHENMRVMKAILDAPDRVFHGVRELPDNILRRIPKKIRPEYTDDWWCYSSRYKGEWEIRPNVKVIFPNGLVYAVYLSEGFKIYAHCAEGSDSTDAFAPDGWQERYGGRTWPKTL